MRSSYLLLAFTFGQLSVTVKAQEKEHSNHLVNETSPYLLTHAHNPVDWYPWGEEAFEKAKKEKKMIFLSVGYSSCHWCHVMERESFEDEEIADYLNQHYVCVKVDREERPDVDQVYMTAVQGFNPTRWMAHECVSPSGWQTVYRRFLFSRSGWRSRRTHGFLHSLNACRLSGRINRSWWSNKQSR